MRCCCLHGAEGARVRGEQARVLAGDEAVHLRGDLRSEADVAVKRSGPDPAGQSSRSSRFLRSETERAEPRM